MDGLHVVEGARTGEQDAFARLVTEYDARVRALAAYYVGPRDAPDVAQEIWLNVHRKLWQLQDSTRFWGWLRQLIYYFCVNYRKRRSRSPEIYLDTEDWAYLVECVADPDFSVEELFEVEELKHQLAQYLDDLPGDYGFLLRLHYVNEMTAPQIAELTDQPLTTIKWRLHEARRTLRGRLAASIKPKEDDHGRTG